jgi:serine/threonine protein kinase/TolB-like protein
MVGQSIGHYKIIEPLGAGGMGEVYLAEDTRSGRKVALKVLPELLTRDRERVLRFQQEARAALALNHPNIVTIYEVGQADSRHFIANELIQGQTLRQRMTASSLKIGEILDIAIQVGSALAEAHQAGIVHRDIKPENIMLRPDGYVKVLDFGLAKLNESEGSIVDTQAPTKVNVKTAPGVVMGTVNYMSPEQLRGGQIDARTDIWSLGVVLYEMVATHPAFSGETSGDVIASILERQPPPLARYSRDAPEALEEIVTTALAKDREERFQTAKQMVASMRRLKQRLDATAELERSTAPDASGTSKTINVHQSAGRTAGEARRQAAVPGSAHTASSAEYLVGGILRHGRVALVALALSLLVITAGIYFYSTRNRDIPIDSLAVLPFANENADETTEYLSDGITESLIYKLSQLPTLRVMASNTVFRYKGRQVDAQSVRQELGVRAILIGKITQRGDALAISAELVDARNNRLLWGDHYNRKFGDILAIQEEISREISQKLQPRLTGEQQKRLTKRYTENTEAYELYLKGNYFRGGKITEEGI